MEEAALNYFRIWNTRSGAALVPLFAVDGTLRDWDIAVSGAGALGAVSSSPRDQRAVRRCRACHNVPPLLPPPPPLFSPPAAVGEANDKIFAAVPAISIEVLHVHVSEATRTAVCEILVHLGDGSSLKVADVIQFDPSLKITALRAYKG